MHTNTYLGQRLFLCGKQYKIHKSPLTKNDCGQLFLQREHSSRYCLEKNKEVL